MGRRSNGSGYLKIRGGVFIARWMYNGKTHERSTHIKVDMVDQNGVPCGRTVAEKVLETYTAPFKLKNEADALAVVARRMETAREESERMEEQASGAITLGDLGDAFEASSLRNNMTERHLSQYKIALREFAAWSGHSTTAESITKKKAATWADYIWKRGISAHTFNCKISFMRCTWNALKHRIGFSTNPWCDIKKRKDGVKTRRSFTKDEFTRLYDIAGNIYGGDVQVMLMIGYHTGMRIGDCATLKWEYVDFKKNMIRVVTGKTGERVSIPMHSQLRKALTDHYIKTTAQYDEADSYEGGWEAYWKTIPAKNAKERLSNVADRKFKDYVVPRMASRYMHEKTLLSSLIRKLLNKIGVETSRRDGQCVHARPVTGFHSLRHGLASRLAEAGVPQRYAMMILGHRSERVHEAYVHVDDEHIKMEFAKLER